MLVAAFNPSSTSDTGTKIVAWLFGEGDIIEPSLVFDSSMSCNQIVNDRLVSLITEFGECLRNNRKHTSQVFPSLCGQSTSAVSGLQKIAAEVEKKGTSRNSAMVMLTDGVIRDNAEERKAVYEKLNHAKTITIAGGIDKADKNNLKRYADNVLFEEKDPVALGLKIVDRLSKTGVICPDHGNLSLFQML